MEQEQLLWFGMLGGLAALWFGVCFAIAGRIRTRD